MVEAAQRLSLDNITLNNLVDIWRGSKAAKIIQSGWNEDPLYGKGRSHSVMEANRMIRKLIMEGFLWNELVVNNFRAWAYVRPGCNAGDLLSGKSGRILLHQVQVLESDENFNLMKL